MSTLQAALVESHRGGLQTFAGRTAQRRQAVRHHVVDVVGKRQFFLLPRLTVHGELAGAPVEILGSHHRDRTRASERGRDRCCPFRGATRLDKDGVRAIENGLQRFGRWLGLPDDKGTKEGEL
jgi:hypothetical protein